MAERPAQPQAWPPARTVTESTVTAGAVVLVGAVGMAAPAQRLSVLRCHGLPSRLGIIS